MMADWSEAESKRMQALADWCEEQAEFEKWRTAERPDAIYAHARESAHWGLNALTIRACLACAGQFIPVVDRERALVLAKAIATQPDYRSQLAESRRLLGL